MLDHDRCDCKYAARLRLADLAVIVGLVAAILLVSVLAAGVAYAGPLDETRFCGPPARNAKGEIIRRADVLRAFVRKHPCPEPVGTACPGWRRDHVIPLACGGCDAVANLQWMPVAAWADKSKWERKIYGGHGMSAGCP